jgi:hypothetical protein
MDATRALDFLAPLAPRPCLAPVFRLAGVEKVAGFDDIVAWFGNPDWGLGPPAPALMAVLATATAVLGPSCCSWVWRSAGPTLAANSPDGGAKKRQFSRQGAKNAQKRARPRLPNQRAPRFRYRLEQP